LSHTSSPFCSILFWRWGLMNDFPWADLEPQPS
jgi:hypothetical protein